jgi:type II secretory pathway component PulF
MTQFDYVALNKGGKEIKGVIDAAHEKEAARLLRNQSYFVIRIAPFSERKKRSAKNKTNHGFFSSIKRNLRTTASDKALFFRQISLMLRSGHTIVQALAMCSELVEKQALSDALVSMEKTIHSGSTVAQAMAKHPRMFSPLIINLVASGELSGQLDKVCDQMADNLEHMIDVRRQLITVLVYPTIVFSLSIIIVSLVMVFVVPKLTAFFAARQVAMPGMMLALVSISDWLAEYGGSMLILFALTIFLTLVAYTTNRGKAIIDRLLLYVPIVGKSIIHASMARFGNTVAMLLQSGMTVKEALGVMAKVLTNHELSEHMKDAANAVLSGKNLSQGLEQPFIPIMVKHMAAVGEKSGELDSVMTATGKYYDRMLSASIKRMVAFVEPALILFVGGIVGFIYIAIFMAIFRASTGGI